MVRMSENKRFTMCFGQNDINGWTMSIVDWQTKEPFDYTTYEVHSSSITDTKDEMEDLCLLLNELSDENERLKIFLKAVNEELSLANRDCDILEEENEQLQNQIDELKQDNDIKFWKHKWLHESNANSVLLFELGKAIDVGYKVSDKFKDFILM
ncbi:MAG: hypothetical protein KIG63_07795 [Methanobrevibacter sp.]|nr:hypothetical protein [Methanobrevibacter sp.]